MTSPSAGFDARLARVDKHLMTKLLPSSTHPIRPQLRQLVYSALVD